jgi:hypothetical protein
MSDIVKRLQAPAYWISGSNEGHEGENNAPREAADIITHLTAEIDLLTNLANDREEYLQLLTDENNKLRSVTVVQETLIRKAEAENEKLKADLVFADTQCAKVEDLLFGSHKENKKLRAALLLAHKYVLVQSCKLSLMSDDAKKDLAVIDLALEERL